MNDSSSVTSLSLAVAEKKPRRNGGCVGVFFQLFDWNRRFTKKKLFSKRLLPPDRTKEASKKFGDDDKLPKLRLIADENNGGFPNKNKNGGNGAQTPTLVARLMGLETMPPGEKLRTDDSGEFDCGRREKFVGDIGIQEYRPQKLQKTAMADRRSVTRFGAEALQLKNVLSQSRKHHHHHTKLASPVKNTSHHGKRNSSRLIGAAARILEPQGRNKSKYAISYGRNLPEPTRAREDLDLSSRQQSCRNCGNLLDVEESSSIDRELEFVASDTGLNGEIRARVGAKGVHMKVESMGKLESRPVDCSSPKPKRQAPRTRKQTGSDAWRPDISGRMGDKFGVPREVRVERGRNKTNVSSCNVSSRKRVISNASDEKIRLQKGILLTVESGINGNPLKKTPDKWEPVSFDSLCFRARKSEKRGGLIGGKKSDHRSPGSVLEASFSNDSCCSSSLEDCSVYTQHGEFMNYSYDDESRFQAIEGFALTRQNMHNEFVADLLTYISQVLCSMDVVISRTDGRNIEEIIFNSELLLSHQMPHNPNEINSFFICDLLLELDTLAGVIWTTFGNFLGSQNPNASIQLKRFVFDSLIEYLEAKYVRYSKCGFRAWVNLPRFMGFDHLVHVVVEEVRRWMGVTAGELVMDMDMSHGSRKWTDFEMEAYEMGAKVEWDIVQSLIDEIVVDFSTGIGVFGV